MAIDPVVLDKYHSLFAGKGEKDINDNEYCIAGNDGRVDYIQRSTVKGDMPVLMFNKYNGVWTFECLHGYQADDLEKFERWIEKETIEAEGVE